MRKHGIRNTFDKLNQMLDDAISGDFEESDYDESELSKLEIKWKRYFASSALSQKRIEEEQNTIKELVTNISHQTKTPLANILLYTQLLNERPLDEESAFLVKEIQTYSEKLEFLIQSLVKLSRLETRTYQFTPVSANLLEISEAITNEATQNAALRNGSSITIHSREFEFFSCVMITHNDEIAQMANRIIRIEVRNKPYKKRSRITKVTAPFLK